MTTLWVSPEAQREAGLNTAHLTDPQVRTPSWPPWPDEASMLTQQPLAFVAELLTCDGFRCLMNLGSQVQVKWLRRKKCAVWKKCLSESYSKVNSSSLFGFGASPGTWPVAQTLSLSLSLLEMFAPLAPGFFLWVYVCEKLHTFGVTVESLEI